MRAEYLISALYDAVGGAAAGLSVDVRKAEDRAIGNLYSMTSYRMTVMMRFKLKENRTAWFEPKNAIFPGNEAPVIRLAEDGERQLEIMNWEFVRLAKSRAPGRVGYVRRDTVLTNRFWTASFRERRCLVPCSSYCELSGLAPASWWWHT